MVINDEVAQNDIEKKVASDTTVVKLSILPVAKAVCFGNMIANDSLS